MAETPPPVERIESAFREKASAAAPTHGETVGDEAERQRHRMLFHGIAWAALARAITQGLSWASTMFVARILTPRDYGLIGMSALYVGLVRLLSEFGLGSAILALRSLGKSEIEQLNSFSIVFGVVGFGLTAAAARPLGLFFHAPALPAVVIASGLVSIISSFRSMPLAILQRDRRFKEISTIEIGQGVVAIGTVIGFAIAGFGYWSLVLNEIAAATYAAVATIQRSPVRFRWPRLRALSAALKFSRDILISRVSWYAYTNSDFLVAGRVLGEAALGVYSFAWTLTNLPIEKVTSVVMSVTPTFFSESQRDNEHLRSYLLILTEGVAFLTFPIAVGVALTGSDFVPLVLGSKWAGAVAPLQILAFYTTVRSVTPFVSQALSMTGRVRHVMWNSVISALIFPPAFFVASHWNASGIALAWVALYPFVAWPLYRRLFLDIDLRTSTYVRALMPAMTGCAAMVVTVLTTHVAFETVPPFARLASEVTVGVATYGIVVLLMFRRRLENFLAIMRHEPS
ncbi:MAG TPA: lipopolysaccharide biosynthesis protein [Gemmatimonadaceae bacterium]|nr:lipopolysaccharide biosynthesis protein [Gemmatimonadaceae bacterium]